MGDKQKVSSEVHFMTEEHDSLNGLLKDAYFRAALGDNFALYHVPNFLEHKIAETLLSKPYISGHSYPEVAHKVDLRKGNLITRVNSRIVFYESKQNPVPLSPVSGRKSPANIEAYEKTKTISDVIKALCEEEDFEVTLEENDGAIGYNLRALRADIKLKCRIHVSAGKDSYGVSISQKIFKINVLPKGTSVIVGLSEPGS